MGGDKLKKNSIKERPNEGTNKGNSNGKNNIV